MAQQIVKRATGRDVRFTAADFIRRSLRTKIERFNAAGTEPPGVVVEQGTGWHGQDLVLFHLAGARRILTYDTTPWLRMDLLRRNAEVLAAATDIVKHWRGTVPARVDERAERLQGSLDRPREALLQHLGATVRVTRSMDRSEIDPASVDLFYSNSVLQFMEPGDLTTLVVHARRFLKSSGRCFHVVDCFDLHAHNDPRIPPLAYLAWPEPAWNLLTDRYLNYQNRWRMPQFRRLIESAGFSARILNPVVDAPDIAYVQRRLGLAPEARPPVSMWARRAGAETQRGHKAEPSRLGQIDRRDPHRHECQETRSPLARTRAHEVELKTPVSGRQKWPVLRCPQMAGFDPPTEVPGQVGAERVHQLRRARPRDPEQLLDVATREQLPVQASSCRMASGMASSHCDLAGTGCAFRLQLLLRVRVGEEVGHARSSRQVSRGSHRIQDGRRRGRDAHNGRYGICQEKAKEPRPSPAGPAKRRKIRLSAARREVRAAIALEPQKVVFLRPGGNRLVQRQPRRVDLTDRM